MQEKAPAAKEAATALQVTPEAPERLSATVPTTVRFGSVTVVPSTGGTNARAGGVLSILRVTLAVAESPLASVAVPVTS